MNRRTLLRVLGCGAAAGFAGCLTQGGDEQAARVEDDDALVVATVQSFIEPVSEVGEESAPDDEGEDEPIEPASEWLRTAFEEEFDVDLVWTVPEDGVTQYVLRTRYGAAVEADVYLGLTGDDLALVDDELGRGTLFEPLERDRLERDGRVREALGFGDPFDRVVPYGVEYVCLLADESVIDPPTSFDDLVDPAYEGTLLLPDPQGTVLGRAFLFWTIATFGEDDAVAYWNELLENDVELVPGRREAVEAYLAEDRPMVVSHSAARVAAVVEDRDLSRYRVSFLDEQGYANVGGMAVFAAHTSEVAYDFLDFVLSRDVQAELSSRTHRFPAVTDEYVDPQAPFSEYALEPPGSVQLTYDELSENVDDWLDLWAQLVAGRA